MRGKTTASSEHSGVAVHPRPDTIGKRGVWARSFRTYRYVYVMAVPVVLYYLLFHYGPMYGAVIAFKRFDIGRGILASPWVGFLYFRQFFESVYFFRLMRNTLLISLYDIVWGFPVPIILALLLNEIRSTTFKRSVQTISYLPHFISIVVVAGMVRDFVARDGIITGFLVSLGAEQTNLLSVPGYFRTIYVASNVWQQAGWGSIIYLAALSGIDPQLYEAATIDGARRFQKMLHVTLPGLMPTIVVLLILRIGNALNVGFEKIILLYSPAIYETADVISTFVYRRGLGESFEFSYTAAVGLFRSAINLFLLVGSNTVSRRVSDASLW